MGEPVDLVDALLRSDGHVHSAFSDGRSSPGENLRAAIGAGLRSLVMVDHVRADTAWLPDLVAAVHELRYDAPIEVLVGIETKVLDAAGHLDLPTDLTGVDRILIADHRYPGPGGPLHPEVVRERVLTGGITPSAVAEDLVAALVAAIGRAPAPAVVAHPFSILPKVGIDEADVPPDALRALAAACRASGTLVEVNEKWACPGPATVAMLLDERVSITAGSDAHDAGAVGRWDRVRETLAAALAGSVRGHGAMSGAPAASIG